MKNSNPLEKDIEAAVVKYGKSLGCLCYKFTSPSWRSVPDRLFIGPKGLVWFIEFKRLGCKPTEAQAVEIEKIREKGVTVWVIDSVEAGKSVISDMVKTKTFAMSDL